MKLTKPKFYLWAVVGWAALIFVLCTLPSSGLPKAPFMKGIDKLIHAFSYFVLAFLMIKRGKAKSWTTKKSITYALMVSICYGIVIECIQGQFLPSRSFEIKDIFANISGSFLAAFCLGIKYIRK